MTNPTDTNQASEDELDNILDNIFWLGYKFAIDKLDKTPNEYLAETIEAIAAIIRTEKLKLLDEVRERQIPVIALKAKKPHDEVQIQAVPIESLSELEAEL